MPVSALSVLSPDALAHYVDLPSVPKHRYFGKSDIIERLRKAVPFEYVFIAGLDVENYRFGEGVSIDTDLPPAFLEAYAGGLQTIDQSLDLAGTDRQHMRSRDYRHSTIHDFRQHFDPW
jgi:hypothetical protein